MKTQEQGAFGEALARNFLESEGYRFIQANFNRRVGEIDLIMLAPAMDQTPRTIVFVEVRYRTTSQFGGALASIDWKKQRKLVRTATAWLQKNATSRDCARIDVIALEPSDHTAEGACEETAKASLADASRNALLSVSRDASRGASRANGQIWQNHHLQWIQNAIESVT